MYGGLHIGGTSDPGADNLIVDLDARIGGGLYVGSTGTDPDADDIHYDGNLKSVKSAATYDVYGFHPLTTPLTNTSFDGDSFSAVGASTKVENTSWSSTIPANAKALLLRIAARDSGSAGGTDVYFAVGPSTTYWYYGRAFVGGLVNDAISENNCVVPCVNGDIYYQCTATGASTMDVWMECMGYWI